MSQLQASMYEAVMEKSGLAACDVAAGCSGLSYCASVELAKAPQKTNRRNARRMVVLLRRSEDFTIRAFFPPVVKTSRLSGDSRLVRHIAKKLSPGPSIAREDVSLGFICEGERAAIPETERSCPHDAEEVENIFCVIRSARGQATSCRPLGLGG